VKVEGRGLLLMMLQASGEQNCCPQCHRSSTRAHSYYERKLSDFHGKGFQSGFSYMYGVSSATPRGAGNGSLQSVFQRPCFAILAALAG
jgi:hypothetical protein